MAEAQKQEEFEFEIENEVENEVFPLWRGNPHSYAYLTTPCECNEPLCPICLCLP